MSSPLRYDVADLPLESGPTLVYEDGSVEEERRGMSRNLRFVIATVVSILFAFALVYGYVVGQNDTIAEFCDNSVVAQQEREVCDL